MLPSMTSQRRRIGRSSLLAHEVGHALSPDVVETPMSGFTRTQYVETNLKQHLQDEGAATLNNGVIREEIVKNGGPDIGFSGRKSTTYARIHRQYNAGKFTRTQAQERIGQVFGVSETTSTNGQSYRDYYTKKYKRKWDAMYAGKTKNFVAP